MWCAKALIPFSFRCANARLFFSSLCPSPLTSTSPSFSSSSSSSSSSSRSQSRRGVLQRGHWTLPQLQCPSVRRALHASPLPGLPDRRCPEQLLHLDGEEPPWTRCVFLPVCVCVSVALGRSGWNFSELLFVVLSYANSSLQPFVPWLSPILPFLFSASLFLPSLLSPVFRTPTFHT